MTLSDPTSPAYTVRVAAFEGPLGLLLYLIKKNEVDVYDIPVAEVARQYQDHLEMMEELNLEVAAEFFVMAATLVQIKSRMLLPRPERPDGSVEDPRADLVNQLLELQRIQEAARSLEERQDRSSRLFPRPPGASDSVAEGPRLLEVDLFALVAAFHAILRAERARRPLELEAERFSVASKIEEIEAFLRDAPEGVRFGALFERMTCREEMIAAFLALLELLRAQRLRAIQETPLGDIYLYRRAPDPATSGEGEAPPAAGAP